MCFNVKRITKSLRKMFLLTPAVLQVFCVQRAQACAH